MDDQTRGEAPGEGSGNDVPLKRDRKRLRSSEPWPPAAARPDVEPAPPIDRTEDLREPELREPERRESELSPAEQLFAGQWTASVPTPAMPASTIPPEPTAFPGLPDASPTDDVDLTGPDVADSDVAPPTRRRFGHDFLKKRKAVSEDKEPEPLDEESADSSEVLATDLWSVEAPSTESPSSQSAKEISHSEPDRVPTALYVPPGGFTGPGHPLLGPLVPEPPAKYSGLRALDIAALVTAVIVPPVGFITAIVALVRGRQVRGWASDLARAAVSVSLVMTLVFAAVGGYIWIQETERVEQLAAVKAEQRAHDRVAATSAEFCATLAANPTIYSTADPDYGWPAVDAPGGYNAAISSYSAVWAQIAEIAPPGIAEETAAISQRIAGIVDIANALGSQNRAGDLLGLHAETDLATVESWYVEYCDAPEVAEEPETPAE